MKGLEVYDFTNIQLEDSSFFEGLKYRKDCLVSDSKESISSKLFLISSPNSDFIFRRSDEKESQLFKRKKDLVELFDYFPGLPSRKYKDSIIIPRNTLVLMGWIDLVNPENILMVSIYDAIKYVSKNINPKVHKNDIFVESKKICGVEEYFKPNGTWVEAFINIDISFNKEFISSYLEKNKQEKVCGLRDLNPEVDLEKFKKRLIKNYKDFFEAIHES